MAETQLIQQIEQALTGLVKLMKALRFYPEGHPSLHSAIDDCMAAFQPILKSGDSRAIQINQGGFSLGTEQIGETNPSLPDLARLFAERRVNQLIFLPELPQQEIMTLLAGLTTPAEEIYNLGGLPIFLQNHQTGAIWLNESSLENALEKKKQLDEQEQVSAENDLPHTGLNGIANPIEMERADLAQQVRDVVEKLNAAQEDDAYFAAIDKLVQLAPAFFEQSGIPGVLRILTLLQTHSRQDERNREQRKTAAGALDRLLTSQISSQLLDQFRKTSLTPQQFQRLQLFVVTLGIRIAPELLNAMSKEEDSSVRKRLTTLLGKMGEPLLDLLRETVHSSKWYVVRNAVTVLGDLRLAAGISILNGLTSHPDQRIRRSLIRSLAMIGGRQAVEPLQKLANDPVIGLRRPAVKALGATQCPEATAPLLTIAQTFDPFGRQTEIRTDAVSALGTLGDKNATSTLLALAKRPNMLRLQRLEELRAEIILALGKLGDDKLIPELEKWRRSPHGIVQRAAEQSLTGLTKKNDDTSAD